MAPPTDHVFVAGSYSSQRRRVLLAPNPPATNTLPFGRRVARCPFLAVAMLPAGDHVFVAGSYSSAEASGCEMASSPPATRTFPFPRRVAVCPSLAVAIGAAGDHG